MLGIEEVKQYIQVDTKFDDELIKQLIEQAEIYIDSCVGEEYKNFPNKVKMANLLIKKVVSDLYDNRGLDLKNKSGYDSISNTILDLLSNCGGDD
ncbi:head-tail connector protein [Clostridium sp. LY3-2]|uniref:head-tail connector protein n=1 Tax=Clostridium sp. LY3-2 TaxID=2942482 RepID=UPI0021523350|nr:head-tail connector protein [Clostridium sp. LY3-2]MCR6515808.1 head-tail connector protein [Clostridium sp. LY3-2]